MVKDEEKEKKLKALFTDYLKSGKEEDLFNLFREYQKLLGRLDFLHAAQRIGGDKFKIAVTDGMDVYCVLTNYSPSKAERKAIIKFGILAHGIDKEADIFINKKVTKKHSTDKEGFDEKGDKIYSRYVSWLENYEKKKT